MTADMVFKFFENYGWIMTVLAASGIFVVGVMKSLGIFSKIPKAIKKYLYFACACVVSVISCTIYMCATKTFVWSNWGIMIGCIIAFTISLYGLYENTGMRALITKIFFRPTKNLVQNIHKMLMTNSMSKEKLLKIAQEMGSDVFEEVVNEIKSFEENQNSVEDFTSSPKLASASFNANIGSNEKDKSVKVQKKHKDNSKSKTKKTKLAKSQKVAESGFIQNESLQSNASILNESVSRQIQSENIDMKAQVLNQNFQTQKQSQMQGQNITKHRANENIQTKKRSNIFKKQNENLVGQQQPININDSEAPKASNFFS